MTDIEKAVNLMKSENYSCVLCRGNSYICKSENGIKSLLELCDDNNSYNNYCVADKIVGKAAAMLYVKLGIISVYACVLSEKGEKVLINNNIEYQYETKCSQIINRKKTGICPMEAAVENISDAEEAYTVLKEKIK